MPNLIEKEGRFYKECGFVMLETTNNKECSVDILLCIKSHTEHENTPAETSDVKGNLTLGVSCYITDEFYKRQHLYITSDDEKKDGDLCLCYGEIEDNKQHNCSINDKGYVSPLIKWSSESNCSGCKKIISTTDTSIGYTDHRVSPVPNFCEFYQPSNNFIQAYIDAYNKGEKIEKALVEYEKTLNVIQVGGAGFPEDDIYQTIQQPKIEDNSIIILV